MSNFFYNPYKIESKQITTTTQNAALGFGKKKLANPNPRVVWRSTAIVSQIIEIDMGQTSKADGFYIGNHNFLSGDTVTLHGGKVSGVSIVNYPITPVAGKINEIIKIPRSGPGGPTWNYRYYWLDVTKAGGTYVQVGALIPFANYSGYDLGEGGGVAPPPDPKTLKFNTDGLGGGGRRLNNNEKGYDNEIPFSGFQDRNIYSAIPVYSTGITDIRKGQRALLKSIAESNYHCWLDWGGDKFGVAKISDVNDITEIGDPDKQVASGRLMFWQLDVIEKIVK